VFIFPKLTQHFMKQIWSRPGVGPRVNGSVPLFLRPSAQVCVQWSSCVGWSC